jgi:hypothetical protein
MNFIISSHILIYNSKIKRVVIFLEILSGILIDVKKEMKEKFIEIIRSQDFHFFCEMNNKILPDKSKPNDHWLSISTTTLKKYSY